MKLFKKKKKWAEQNVVCFKSLFQSYYIFGQKSKILFSAQLISSHSCQKQSKINRLLKKSYIDTNPPKTHMLSLSLSFLSISLSHTCTQHTQTQTPHTQAHIPQTHTTHKHIHTKKQALFKEEWLTPVFEKNFSTTQDLLQEDRLCARNAITGGGQLG